MFVKPTPGRKVRDPLTKRHLADAGAEVPSSTYWLRRLDAGDVVAAEAAKPVAPVETEKAAVKPAKGKE